MQHGGKDIVPPLPVGLGPGLDGIGGRGFDGGGQAGGLGGGEILRVHAEGHLCRSLDAVGALAEVDEVQVHLQDLVLGVVVLDLQSQPDLLQLAGDGLLAGEVGELCQLLGDGAGSLGEAAGAQVAHQRAEDAGHVEAGMLVEAQILRRQEGVHHMVGEGVHGDDGAVLLAHQGGDVRAVLVVDGAGLGQARQPGGIEPLPGGHVKPDPGGRHGPDENQDCRHARCPPDHPPLAAH